MNNLVSGLTLDQTKQALLNVNQDDYLAGVRMFEVQPVADLNKYFANQLFLVNFTMFLKERIEREIAASDDQTRCVLNELAICLRDNGTKWHKFDWRCIRRFAILLSDPDFGKPEDIPLPKESLEFISNYGKTNANDWWWKVEDRYEFNWKLVFLLVGISNYTDKPSRAFDAPSPEGFAEMLKFLENYSNDEIIEDVVWKSNLIYNANVAMEETLQLVEMYVHSFTDDRFSRRMEDLAMLERLNTKLLRVDYDYSKLEYKELEILAGVLTFSRTFRQNHPACRVEREQPGEIIPESLTGDFSWYCVALLVHHSKTRTRKTTRGKKK